MGLFGQERRTASNEFKVISLPAKPIPNAIYYVLKGDHVEQWVTDVKGAAFQVKFDLPQNTGGGTGGDVTFSIAAGVALQKGQPVIVTNGSKLALASAANFNTAAVLGFAAEAVSANFPCDVERTQVTLSDWTGISDSSALTPGGRYFLGVNPGTITSIPPTTVGQCLCVVGEAISETTLAINLSEPIQL